MRQEPLKLNTCADCGMYWWAHFRVFADEVIEHCRLQTRDCDLAMWNRAQRRVAFRVKPRDQFWVEVQ